MQLWRGGVLFGLLGIVVGCATTGDGTGHVETAEVGGDSLVTLDDMVVTSPHEGEYAITFVADRGAHNAGLMLRSTHHTEHLRECHAITLTVDGEAIAVGEADYESQETGDNVIENVRVPVPVAELARFEEATEASGTVCDHTFTFDSSQRAEIAFFARNVTE